MCEKIRCSWAGDLPIYVEYHDQEWGRPVHEDNKLFEMLILEGMQAGLSWITVLKKRKAFREAFDCFDPFKVSLYDEEKIQELLANEGIIRKNFYCISISYIYKQSKALYCKLCFIKDSIIIMFETNSLLSFLPEGNILYLCHTACY